MTAPEALLHGAGATSQGTLQDVQDLLPRVVGVVLCIGKTRKLPPLIPGVERAQVMHTGQHFVSSDAGGKEAAAAPPVGRQPKVGREHVGPATDGPLVRRGDSAARTEGGKKFLAVALLVVYRRQGHILHYLVKGRGVCSEEQLSGGAGQRPPARGFLKAAVELTALPDVIERRAADGDAGGVARLGIRREDRGSCPPRHLRRCWRHLVAAEMRQPRGGGWTHLREAAEDGGKDAAVQPFSNGMKNYTYEYVQDMMHLIRKQ